MINKFISATVLSMVLVTGSQAAQVLVLKDDIPFAETSNAGDKVRAECNLGTKLSKFIRAYAKKQKFDIKNESGAKDAMVLEVEIEDVHAPGGGAFSGPKVMRVVGKLSQNGKELGDFEGSRYSTGGAFAVMKGTCSILGRNTKALGRDIAKWLKSPTKDAKLGDLK